MKKADLKIQLVEQAAQIENLEKQLEAKTTESSSWYKRYEEERARIEEMHATFDSIEGCSSRIVKSTEQYTPDVPLSLSARFSSFLLTLVDKS